MYFAGYIIFTRNAHGQGAECNDVWSCAAVEIVIMLDRGAVLCHQVAIVYLVCVRRYLEWLGARVRRCG